MHVVLEDISLVDTVATSDGQHLDKVYINFKSQIHDCGVLKPPENDVGIRSNHAVVYALANLKRIETFKCITYLLLQKILLSTSRGEFRPMVI